MKRSRFIVLVGSLCLVVALLFTSACKPKVEEPVGGDGGFKDVVVAPKQITLKAVTYTDPGNYTTNLFVEFVVDAINERAAREYPGQLFIKYLGGQSIISMAEQYPAFKTGVIDILMASAGIYLDVMPEAQAMKVTRLTPWEERESGAFDLMVELHREKASAVYLGRNCFGGQYIITVKRYATPYEFSGLMFNAPRGYVKSLGAIGIKATSFAGGESYSAMERGLVVGDLSTVNIEAVEGLTMELAKYVYDHPFAHCSVNGLINTQSWDRLPKHLQDLITEVVHEAERVIYEEYNRTIEHGRRVIMAAGIQFVKFSDADAKWMVDTIENALWANDVQPKVTPEMAAKLWGVFRPGEPYPG